MNTTYSKGVTLHEIDTRSGLCWFRTVLVQDCVGSGLCWFGTVLVQDITDPHPVQPQRCKPPQKRSDPSQAAYSGVVSPAGHMHDQGAPTATLTPEQVLIKPQRLHRPDPVTIRSQQRLHQASTALLTVWLVTTQLGGDIRHAGNGRLRNHSGRVSLTGL